MDRPVKDFRADLKVGQEYEKKLIAYFSRFFDVREATRDQQTVGIDFVLVKPDGTEVRVELKADRRSKSTGNAFVETTSQVEANVPGWAWSTQADVLIYWVLPNEVIVVKPEALRSELEGWMAAHPMKLICNRGWHTAGYLVPLDKLRAIALYTGRLDA